MRFALAFVLLVALPGQGAEAWEAFFDPFLGDLRAELDEAKRTGRKGAVIMYHFEECPYCQRMKREVLSRPFAKEQKVRGTPTFDFYGVDGGRLYRHVGGLFDPAEFLLLGRYAASGAHRSLTFSEYKRKTRGS